MPSISVNASARLLAVLLAATLTGIACRTGSRAGVPAQAPAPPPRPAAGAPPVIQPGAPGQPGRVIDAQQSAQGGVLPYTPADVRFMQGMIGHHAQAIEMVRLLMTNSASAEMKLLGKRIEVSQEDEIQMMQDWLKARGQPLPDPHAHHQAGAALMPGMLTAEEMSRLSAAKGVAFDRLFLEGMIKHHQGALTMVRELFATPGAGQDVEIYSFASDVDADQRMEIDRMGAMLAQLKERKE
jgi:uncharacterized protein (DUF305 family)